MLGFAFGPDGTTIVGGYRNGQVHVFDAWLKWIAGWGPRKRYECFAVGFRADDHSLFAGGADQALKFYTLNNVINLKQHPSAAR